MKRTILILLFLGVTIMTTRLMHASDDEEMAPALALQSQAYGGMSGSTPQQGRDRTNWPELAGRPRAGLVQTAAVAWRFLFDKPSDTRPAGMIPVESLSRAMLDEAPDGSVFRLGHSTVLLKLGGVFWLTDPMFSQRASPVGWAGPARFHQPPITIAELPPIKAVIISHDHYDHLDKDSILALAGKTEHFLTPTGVGDILTDWGVETAKVRQLPWWGSVEVGGARLTVTPAKHFSGRGVMGGDRTLWASWVIECAGRRVFFSGDSGYFPGFKEIGDRFGPFDLTLIETGAYDVNWPGAHMQPEETMRAHLDLRGKTLLPIHNGTFDLSMHAWDDPFERITALGEMLAVRVLTPKMGERAGIADGGEDHGWWRAVETRRPGEAAPQTRSAEKAHPEPAQAGIAGG